MREWPVEHVMFGPDPGVGVLFLIVRALVPEISEGISIDPEQSADESEAGGR